MTVSNWSDAAFWIVIVIAIVLARMYRLKLAHEEIMWGYRKPEVEEEEETKRHNQFFNSKTKE